MINDTYKLMMGVDLEITPQITLKHPTVKHICEVGEAKYFAHVTTFVATPTDLKVELDDAGINFEDISDFYLFCMRSETFKGTQMAKLITGFDFAYAYPIVGEDGQLILFDPSHNALLDEVHYLILCNYIRAIHGLTKNVEIYGNEYTRKMVIEIERDARKHKDHKEYEPFVLDYISGLINCSESKYDYKNIWDLPYYVFIDAIRRVQKVMEFKGLMSGMYSGMVDTSKLDFEKMSWIGSLSH